MIRIIAIVIIVLSCVSSQAQRFIKTVGTIADLRALNVADVTGTNVFINGTSTNNDGGQSIWSWTPNDTATTNGIIVTSSSGGVGRWRKQVYGAGNVSGLGTTGVVPKWSNTNGGLTDGPITIVGNNTKLTGDLVFTNLGSVQAVGDGVFAVKNNAGTGFGRFIFIGSASTNVGIAPNGTTLQVVRADNGALSGLEASTAQFSTSLQVGTGGTSPLIVSGTNTAIIGQETISGGNLGVGTLTPTNKIHVINGNIQIGTGGTLYVGNPADYPTTDPTSLAGSIFGPRGFYIVVGTNNLSMFEVDTSGTLILGDERGDGTLTRAEDYHSWALGGAYDHKMWLNASGLGIMTTNPAASVEINSATGVNLRLTYNDTNGAAVNYSDFTLSSGGNLFMTPSGGLASVIGSFAASGSVTAGTVFSGNGSLITALNGSAITTGTVAPARMGSGVTDATTYLAGDGTWKTYSAGTTTGTVTSVAMTVPTGFSVSGSPITTSGTLAISESTQTANQIKAGPTSGGAATPTYRTMVGADIPDALVIATTKLSATGTKNSSTFLRGDDTWGTPSGGSGTFFANPSASIGLSAINGSDTNAMRADGAPALSQAIAPTWTGTHIFRKTTSPVQFQYDATHLWDITLDSAGTPTSTTTTGTNSFSGIVNATVGYTVAGAAANGSFLRGNGTAAVFAQIAGSDIATGTIDRDRMGSGGTGGGILFLRDDNVWAIPSGGGGGTSFANPTGTVGLSAVNGTSTNAMRADAAPPLSQAIIPTWTGLHSFLNSTTNQVKIGYDITQVTWLSTDSSGNFNIYPTSAEMNVAGYVDAQSGFKVNNAAGSALYLRGDGTKGVFATLSASDLGTGTVPTARLGSGAAGATTFLSGDQTWKTAVTSVGLTGPTEFTFSGAITTAGNLSFTKVAQVANTVYAGPSSGADAQPTFRPLVQSDVPAGTIVVLSTAEINGKTWTTADTALTTGNFLVTGYAFLFTNATFDGTTGPTFSVAATSSGAQTIHNGSLAPTVTNNYQHYPWTANVPNITNVVPVGTPFRVTRSAWSDSTTFNFKVLVYGFYL